MPTDFEQVFTINTPVLQADGEVNENSYAWLAQMDEAGLALQPEALQGDVVLPANQLNRLPYISGKKAVLLTATESPESLKLPLEQLDMIAIDFADFNDGRGYSFAALLRRDGFDGELRAVGDVFQDTLFYLKRCGFDSFVLKAEQCHRAAKNGLGTFSQPYQTSVVDKNRSS